MKINNDINLSITEKDYFNAKEQFIYLCDSCNISYKQIGFFGEVESFGISDLDALVIGNSKTLKRLDQLYKKTLIESKNFGYIFWHKPVFILDNITSNIYKLHTLKKIKFVENNVELVDRNLQITNIDKNLLNIIWFIYLLSVVSEIYKKIAHNRPVSLRLLLLVYKNLSYSLRCFSLQNEKHPSNIVTSQDLRKIIEKGYDFRLNQYIFDNLSLLLESTCKKFDNYCNNQLWYTPTLFKSAIITKAIIYKKSISTRIESKYVKKLYFNDIAFSIIFDYYKEKSNCNALQDYINICKFCKKEYKISGIDYPFIAPFLFPSSVIGRSILSMANKININKFGL